VRSQRRPVSVSILSRLKETWYCAAMNGLVSSWTCSCSAFVAVGSCDLFKPTRRHMASGAGEGSGLRAVLPTLAARRRAVSSVLKICTSLHGPARASRGEGTKNLGPCDARLSPGSKRRRWGSSAFGAHWWGWRGQWPSARASRTLLAAALGAIVIMPSCAQQPVAPSKLDFSQFQYTSINASWTRVSTGPGAAASYDLRWRAAGAAVWMAGRELSAVESSFVVAGECTFDISLVCVMLQG
jgi:hypothetical protein